MGLLVYGIKSRILNVFGPGKNLLMLPSFEVGVMQNITFALCIIMHMPKEY